MPVQKEVIRLLPSELLLLPPGDKANPGALELQNWRVDQQGVLRSRRGSESEASGFGGPFHTLFRWADDRYGLSGTNLHIGPAFGTFLGAGFSGEPCSIIANQGLAWIMDRTKPSKSDGTVVRNWSITAPVAAPSAAAGGTLTTALATFDDTEPWDVLDPNGLANQWLVQSDRTQLTAAGTVAVTNGSATIVGTGTSFNVGMVGALVTIYQGSDTTYSVVASYTSPTHIDLIDTIVAPTASGLSFEIYTDATTVTETRQFDAVNKTQGTHSLRSVCSPVGRWSARQVFGAAKDTRISGGQRGDDQFRFQFYASDPAEVEKIAVTLLNGTGGSRSFMTAELPASAINPARYTWQELSILRGIAGTQGIFADSVYVELQTQYGYQISQENHAAAAIILQRMVQRQEEIQAEQTSFSGSTDFDWTAVTEIQIDFYLTNASDIQLDDAYFIGGVTASLQGDFNYAVAFTNIWDHESNFGPYSAAVTLDKQSAALTAIPVSADPQVNNKYIYRIGGGVNEPLRVATLANATTTWTDTISIQEQQRNNIRGQENNDPAPAAWGVVQHGGRLYAWKGNRLYWSEIAKPYAFPGADDDFEGNWEDVGTDGEDIIICTSHGNQLWIYKTKTIWRVLGDADTEGVEPEQTHAGFGGLGIRAVAQAGDVDYFEAGEGVFSFNGDQARKVSSQVDPLFKSDYVSLTTSSFRTPASQGTLATSALGYRNGRLYVSYPEEGQATPNRTLVLDVDTGRWYDHTGGFRCFFDEGQGSRLLGGKEDGSVVSLEQLSADAGAAIALRWRTGYLDQGVPDNKKRYSDIVIEYETSIGGETGPATLAVSLVLDNGDTVIALGNLNSSSRTTVTFSPALGTEWEGKNFSLLVTGNTTTTVFIYAAYAHYYVLPRKGCSFDSDITDLGTRLVKKIEAVELDIEASADTTAVWRMSTDLPGNAMAVRQNNSTAIAAGRRTVTIPIPSPCEGRRVRFQYTSAGCPELFGVRIRYRVDGEYFEAGQVWTAAIEDLAELNLFGAIEMIADTTGPVGLSVLTELAGYDLTSKFAVNIDTTSTTGRTPIMLPLPHATRGKLVQVTLTPGANTLRLYKLRLWARNFDKSSGGGNWRWLTLFTEPESEQSKWVDLAV